jgi:hypothetical protein
MAKRPAGAKALLIWMDLIGTTEVVPCYKAGSTRIKLGFSLRIDGKKSKSRFPSGMTDKKSNCKSEDSSRFPSGMTDKKSNCKSKNNSRFPSGMTNRTAKTE